METEREPVSLECSFPGCDRHPSKGDDILRINAKGVPFVGRCRKHYGAEIPADLADDLDFARRAPLSPDSPVVRRLADDPS